MPTTIIQLLGFEGPNLFGPQPAVFLQVQSDSDLSRRLKTALKDAAQSVGMVLGYLEVSARRGPAGQIISANFTTPTPAIGVALAEYVVEGLNRHAAGDAEWDAEQPLWELQKRRRAEALPLPALQIIAEAASRSIPSFIRTDGLVQLGYGARGWAFDPAQFQKRAERPSLLGDDEVGIGLPPFAGPPATLEVPWQRLGPIPIVAVSGGDARDIAAHTIAAALDAMGQPTSLAVAAGFDATRDLLSDARGAIAVLGLSADGIAQRGLALERCAYSAIVDLPGDLPAGIADHAELARVLGVPMLITDPAGRVVLNADVPAIAALAEYAPCPIIYIGTGGDNTTIGVHRAQGGMAVFVREGLVIAAHGAAEQAVLQATLPPATLPGALAAIALLHAMGLSWEQIRGDRA